MADTSTMKGVNPYAKELTQTQVDSGLCREHIGGLWEEMGQLQFNFLLSQGLKPHHRLLDLGCGCLRGGVKFVPYMERRHYYGMDISQTLLDAGLNELSQAGLEPECVTLIASDAFEVGTFGVQFDYILSISLFTHLNLNHIAACLKQVKPHLAEGGAFYASVFEAPKSICTEQVLHEPGHMQSSYFSDPYHQSQEELHLLAKMAGLEMDFIGDWSHPRGQRMAKFY